MTLVATSAHGQQHHSVVPYPTSGLAGITIERVRRFFRSETNHRPSEQTMAALGDLTKTLAAMANGTAEPKYYLSSLDPGQGKTTCGLEFTIGRKHVVIPIYCPALGLELKTEEGPMADNSPTLDRIDPTKGYIPGNVVVVSARTNRLKSNATIRELRNIAGFYQQLVN